MRAMAFGQCLVAGTVRSTSACAIEGPANANVMAMIDHGPSVMNEQGQSFALTECS